MLLKVGFLYIKREADGSYTEFKHEFVLDLNVILEQLPAWLLRRTKLLKA